MTYQMFYIYLERIFIGIIKKLQLTSRSMLQRICLELSDWLMLNLQMSFCLLGFDAVVWYEVGSCPLPYTSVAVIITCDHNSHWTHHHNRYYLPRVQVHTSVFICILPNSGLSLQGGFYLRPSCPVVLTLVMVFF